MLESGLSLYCNPMVLVQNAVSMRYLEIVLCVWLPNLLSDQSYLDRLEYESQNVIVLPSDCSGSAAPDNGYLFPTNVTHGNYTTVSCKTGFKLEGNHILVCFSGSLLGNMGTCEAGILYKISSHEYVSPC